MMKKIIFCLMIGVIGLNSFAGPPDSLSWKLSWREEFNGDTLDPETWTLGQEWSQDDCAYPSEPVINGEKLFEVSDGTLKEYSWNESYGGKPYVGCLVKSRQTGSKPALFTFHYGYLETRIKRTAIGEGYHINAYTYAYDESTLPTSSNGGHVWPSEIDFAETLSRDFYRDRILNALHVRVDGVKVDDEYWNTGINWSDWVIYGFHWREEDKKVEFYINNQLVHVSDEQVLPDFPHYLCLRIGVGGWIGEPNAQTQFPGIQEVDWVRYYQKRKNLSISLTSPENGELLAAGENLVISTEAANDAGNISKVEVYADGELIDSSKTSPYQVTWENAPEGRYTLTAKVFGEDATFLESDPVYITIGDIASNYIFNGEFDNQSNNWVITTENNAAGSLIITQPGLSGNNGAIVNINTRGPNSTDVKLKQKLYLKNDNEYQLCFNAKASHARRIIVSVKASNGKRIELLKATDLTTDNQEFCYTFQSDGDDFFSGLEFSVGDDTGKVYIDNVILKDYTVGVVNRQKSEKISVYPNPADDFLTISMEENGTGNKPFQVSLFDLSGKLLITESVMSNTVNLNIERINPGLYIIEANNSIGKSRMKIIIK